jgi:hypothetical protein
MWSIAVDARDVVHGDGVVGYPVNSQDLADGFCGYRAYCTPDDFLPPPQLADFRLKDLRRIA